MSVERANRCPTKKQGGEKQPFIKQEALRCNI